MGNSVGRTIDLFLAHLSDSVTPSTYGWYANFLREFRMFAGERRLRAISPSLIDRWLAKRYGDQSASTRHAAARTVCRLVNWAVDEGHMDKSPLTTYRKPAATNRELVLSGADYAAMVKAAKKPLKDVIKFLWHTGCRPQELRAIEARWVRNQKITLPMAISKGGKKRRVIYLDAMAGAIAARRAVCHTSGPIFRNSKGNPWTARALGQAFVALRKRSGVEGVCAYSIRHTWITRMLEQGAGVAVVAALAGNSPQMVLDVYSHVAENEAHLRATLDARKNPPPEREGEG